MRINFYIILIHISFLFFGCAYYNTFYNAKKSFEDAEIIIDQTKKTEENDIPQQAKKLLSLSIEKSQKVIEEFPKSKYIDDSYFLIGKSSFIKGDYQYSEKYFRKLINEYPNSNLFIESKLWISYTFLKNNFLDSSLFYINNINQESVLDDKHNYLKYTILAEVDLLNNLLDSAYKNFEKSVEYIKKDSKKSAIFEKLVKIAELNDDKIKAIYFLDKLNYFSQTDELRYESKLKWLKYNRELDNLNDVNLEIDKLLSRSDYEKIYLSLELERVKILLSKGKNTSAKENLLYIVENNTKQKETAESYYLLGLHYLRNDWDLDKAKEYFTNVKQEYSRSIYLDNAIELKNTIEKYQGLKKVFNSQQSGDSSIVEFTIDEEERVDETLDLGFNISGLNPNVVGQYPSPNLNIPEFEEENLSSVVIKGTIDSLIFAMGEILYFDFQQLDSAESKFKYLYENYPQSKFTPQAAYIMSNTIVDSSVWKERLINEYPDSQFSKALQGIKVKINTNDLLDSMRDDIWKIVNTYPDSAAQQFFHLYDSLNDAKSLYSTAYIYDYFLNDFDNTIFYYQSYLDLFPEGDFVNEIDQRLQTIAPDYKTTNNRKYDSFWRNNNIFPLSINDSFFKGPNNAEVTIVKWSSFFELNSKKTLNLTDSIMSKYDGKIKLVFKNYPLTIPQKKNGELNYEIGDIVEYINNSSSKKHLRYLMALWTLGAGLQNKYFEMFDKVIQLDGDELLTDPNILLKTAKDLDLDIEKLIKDINSEELKYRLFEEVHDLKYLIDYGISNKNRIGIPTFLINGKQPKYKNIDLWVSIIDSILGTQDTAFVNKSLQDSSLNIMPELPPLDIIIVDEEKVLDTTNTNSDSSIVENIPDTTSHFIVELSNTGKFKRITFLDSITSLEPGDEIGIFCNEGVIKECDPRDGCLNPEYGELLVGAGIWDGTDLKIKVIESQNIYKTILNGYPKKVPGTSKRGYGVGPNIIIKVWKPIQKKEYLVKGTWPEKSPIWKPTFDYGENILIVSEIQFLNELEDYFLPQKSSSDTSISYNGPNDKIDPLVSDIIKPIIDNVIKADYKIEDIIHWNDHIIKKGETLEKISYQYYQTIHMVDSIFIWNSSVFDDDVNIIYPYTIIKLKSDEIIEEIAYYNDHLILSGETLWSISKKILNDPFAWVLIYNDNKTILINGENDLKPGTIIKIRNFIDN